MNIEMYSKNNCNFCTKTKNLLNKYNVPYTEYKLDEDFTRDILLEKFPTAKTFPVIVLDGYWIGGYMELNEKIQETFNDTRKLLNE